MQCNSLSSNWILLRQEVDLMEALQRSIVVKREQLLSQGEQGHWAPETGESHPHGGRDNGRGDGRRLMATILPSQSCLCLFVHSTCMQIWQRLPFCNYSSILPVCNLGGDVFRACRFFKSSLDIIPCSCGSEPGLRCMLRWLGYSLFAGKPHFSC